MTPNEKRKAARAENKRLEEIELQKQAEEIIERMMKKTPPRDSSMRGTLRYNAWQRGQRTGQVFRCQGR